MIEIAGRVALVTGGGSGIGRSLAIGLARKGASVILADIGTGRGPAVAEEILRSGGSAVAISCDVSDRDSVHRLKAEAERTLGLPTLLFANAGVTGYGNIEETKVQDIDWLIEVNFNGVFHCMETFLPHIVAHGSGHVVTTASMAGLIPTWQPLHAPYAATKLGLIGLMLSMRGDYAQRGVGFTVLCPGAVWTRITEGPTVRPVRFGGPGEPIAFQKEVIERTGIVFREPDDVAKMVLQAIQNNRAIVLTDETRRQMFLDTYVKDVMDAFDDAEAFAKEQKSQA